MKKMVVPAQMLVSSFTPLYLLFFVFLLHGCKKEEDKVAANALANGATSKKGGNGGNPHTPPPPAPAQFYFSDCNTNPQYSAVFVAGQATNLTVTKTYVNSPGGSYGAFTTANINGITFTAQAGTFNVGTGSVTFTATGTPVNAGFFHTWISVGNIQPCLIYFYVKNAPVSGPTADPGTTPGSTGIVNFTYKGQAVAYKTVRANDGKIWLQQNLGSPQVAFSERDFSSFGDYFQWGRWDDGHQTPGSPVIAGSSTLMNPSHISFGNSNFIMGGTAGTNWWGLGGLSSDTWSGTTVSSTNGKDPCAALGAGWHMPTSSEWQTVSIKEDLFGTTAAFMSNLVMTAAGDRGFQNGDVGYYWSSEADNANAKMFFFDNNTYNAGISSQVRADGLPCRCVK